MSDKPLEIDFSIDRFRKGDRDEFRWIYNKYYDALYIFVYRIVKKETEAEDILSDSFIKLWRLRERFDSLDKIRNSLYLICKNASIDHLRHVQKELKALNWLEKPENDIENRNEKITAEVLAELAKKIELLPDKCQKIVKLIYYNNLSTAEVAIQMGISNQNVLNQKARAIQILRSSIQK